MSGSTEEEDFRTHGLLCSCCAGDYDYPLEYSARASEVVRCMYVLPLSSSHMLLIPSTTKCYCGGGSSADDFDELSINCVATCGGDDTEICGGSSAMSIYRIPDVSIVGENAFIFVRHSAIFISFALRQILQIDPDIPIMYDSRDETRVVGNSMFKTGSAYIEDLVGA